MALSANTSRVFAVNAGINQLPVKASSTIYKGGAVGITSGYARALVAGDAFAGFALEPATGTGSDGGVTVNVQCNGLVKLSVTSAAQTDIGKDVYASDDGTFTFTAVSNSFIGKMIRLDASGVVIVAFDVGLT